MGGVVEFAGPFKSYGNIILIKHNHKYHSLVAGLEKISSVVGQSVEAGEPLGQMGKNMSDGRPPNLYYELRHRGQPINPSRKINGL